jgi:hypothetical protein
MRGLDADEPQETAECDDMLENTEAWPDDPELVDETEMRGRWSMAVWPWGAW